MLRTKLPYFGGFMSIEALWRVQFQSNSPQLVLPAGAGVVIFETGRIFGGDSAMYYLGAYSVKANVLSGTLHVGTHTAIPGVQSVFGPRPEFDLILSGTIEGDQIKVRGLLRQDRRYELTAILERLKDLP